MDINQELIRALKSNNRLKIEEAFEDIYNEYHQLLFYIIVKIVKRKEIAEDLVNDVFLAFFNNLNNLDETRNVKYYLVQSAKNASINYLRKTNNNPLEFNDDEILLTPDQNPQMGSWQTFVNDFKGVISDDDIDIIVKHLVFNWPFIEIAKERGTRIDIITGRYRRALSKLKKYFKEV